MLNIYKTPPLSVGLALELLPLVLSIVLVFDGLGAAVRVAVVIKEAAEGELVEGMLRVLAVPEPGAQSVIMVAVITPQLVRVHGIKVGRVCAVSDLGYVRRRMRLLTHVHAEVHTPEKGVRFDLVSSVLTQPVFRPAAQLYDQIGRLGAQLGLRRNVQ